MSNGRAAPSSMHVIHAIARREVAIAARRRLLRLLFVASLGPPLVLAVTLLVSVYAEQLTHADLDWDPVLDFLRFQMLPVGFLALGLGTPSVARDRGEEVLFLYATRPVMPWHYALGKMLAVALPTGALLLVPGVLIALLRQGILTEVGAGDSLLMTGKVLLASVLVAWAYAGVSVGPSAATRRTRWALLLAIAIVLIPEAVGEALWGQGSFPLSARAAIMQLLDALFEDAGLVRGIGSAGVLVFYGTLGVVITMLRVRKEMTP